MNRLMNFIVEWWVPFIIIPVMAIVLLYGMGDRSRKGSLPTSAPYKVERPREESR